MHGRPRRAEAKPNALKFERFIFDLLPHAKNPFVVEYAEADVFAPLKNAPGADRDTPEYVQQFMIAQHRNWLTAAGVKSCRRASRSKSVRCGRSMPKPSRHAPIDRNRLTSRRILPDD